MSVHTDSSGAWLGSSASSSAGPSRTGHRRPGCCRRACITRCGHVADPRCTPRSTGSPCTELVSTCTGRRSSGGWPSTAAGTQPSIQPPCTPRGQVHLRPAEPARLRCPDRRLHRRGGLRGRPRGDRWIPGVMRLGPSSVPGLARHAGVSGHQPPARHRRPRRRVDVPDFCSAVYALGLCRRRAQARIEGCQSTRSSHGEPPLNTYGGQRRRAYARLLDQVQPNDRPHQRASS